MSTELKQIICDAFEQRNTLSPDNCTAKSKEAILQVIHFLETGEYRICEKQQDQSRNISKTEIPNCIINVNSVVGANVVLYRGVKIGRNNFCRIITTNEESDKR